MESETNKYFNNSKAAREQALAALKRAKELERQQLKNGAKWIHGQKQAVLQKKEK